MARKISESIIRHAAQLVTDGMLVKDAAKNIGICPTVLSAKFRDIGFKAPRGRGRPEKISLPVERIQSMYQNGESENAIAKHFGVSRNVIRKRLIRSGIKPRTQSEAEKLKWAKMDEKARAEQVKAAHAATAGITRSDSTKRKLAKTRERLKYGHLVGVGEIEFCKLLSDRGIDFTHQKAVNFYNVDIAIGNIAVELSSCCGRYTMLNPKEIKRAENLLECGYHVVAVEFDSLDTLIRCADDVIAFIDEASRLKPVDREYWVIRCRAKDYTIITNNLGQFTSVPSPVEFLAKRTVVYLD